MKKLTPLFFAKLPRPLLILALGFLIAAPSQSAGTLNINPKDAPDTCNTRTAQVRVTVKNVIAGGALNIELYDDPDHFLSKKGRKRKVRIPAAAGQQTACINLERTGTYAVAVYQDLDGDRKLKKNWNLLPLEPFGLSNNPEQSAGFPRFSDSAFTTGKLGADIVINLQQP